MPIHFTTEPYTLTHLFPLWYNETMKLLRYLLLSDVALFTLIPLLLRFINKDVALGAMLVLYYGVYPIHFAVIGFFSGKEKLPYLPIVTFGIFDGGGLHRKPYCKEKIKVTAVTFSLL